MHVERNKKKEGEKNYIYFNMMLYIIYVGGQSGAARVYKDCQKEKNEMVNTMCLFVYDKQDKHEQAHGVVTTTTYTLFV